MSVCPESEQRKHESSARDTRTCRRTGGEVSTGRQTAERGREGEKHSRLGSDGGKALSKDQTVSYRLRLGKETDIQNLKPAVVKIYDYYTPSDQAETEYTSPCAAPTDQN